MHKKTGRGLKNPPNGSRVLKIPKTGWGLKMSYPTLLWLSPWYALAGKRDYKILALLWQYIVYHGKTISYFFLTLCTKIRNFLPLVSKSGFFLLEMPPVPLCPPVLLPIVPVVCQLCPLYFFRSFYPPVPKWGFVITGNMYFVFALLNIHSVVLVAMTYQIQHWSLNKCHLIL